MAPIWDLFCLSNAGYARKTGRFVDLAAPLFWWCAGKKHLHLVGCGYAAQTAAAFSAGHPVMLISKTNRDGTSMWMSRARTELALIICCRPIPT
jgi:hypothetical protein